MNSLFIANKNNEWRPFVVRIDSPALISFYCLCFVFLYLFLFFSVFLIFYGEHLRETDISIFTSYSLIVTCSLDALRKSLKRKEMRMRKGNS